MVSLVFYSNFVPKTHRFWDIRLVTYSDLETRITQVIKNDTIQSGTHNFLLTFHSNRRPCTISEINGDFRRKSPIFPTPVYAPA